MTIRKNDDYKKMMITRKWWLKIKIYIYIYIYIYISYFMIQKWYINNKYN